ncbi:hypothetical protein ACI8AG_13215 [Blastococcus sp. SYSU DS0552]
MPDAGAPSATPAWPVLTAAATVTQPSSSPATAAGSTRPRPSTGRSCNRAQATAAAATMQNRSTTGTSGTDTPIMGKAISHAVLPANAAASGQPVRRCSSRPRWAGSAWYTAQASDPAKTTPQTLKA